MTARIWRIGILTMLALALLGVVIWYVASHLERGEKEVTLPPRGEATYNPLYALKRSLEHAGIPVHSRRRLQLEMHPLGGSDTLVLRGDVRRMAGADVEAIDAWVRDGGHLIVELPSVALEDTIDDDGTLLSRIGVLPYGGEYACHALSVQPTQNVELCGTVTADVADDVEVLAGWVTEDDFVPYVRVAHGDGTVDVLTTLDVVDNDQLERPGHAVFARQLLGPGYGQGRVHLIYDAQMPPLWRTLLERGWPVWVPGVLALLAWMFTRSQRFGPWLPAPIPDRRSLLEHVQASGRLLHRHGQSRLLYSAIREQFFDRLRQRVPYAAALDGGAQAQAIAEHLGAPVAEVQAALVPPLPDNPADLQRRIAQLNRMRRQL